MYSVNYTEYICIVHVQDWDIHILMHIGTMISYGIPEYYYIYILLGKSYDIHKLLHSSHTKFPGIALIVAGDLNTLANSQSP